LIGGGGKTTLMLSMAAAAVELGMPVLVTTTTHIRTPDGMPLILQEGQQDLEDALGGRWAREPVLALGKCTTDAGKVIGVEPSLLCHLKQRFPRVLILCEADGSAGRPLKIHAGHEPVIPGCSTAVYVVAGLDALGSPVSSETIHRVELLEIEGSPLLREKDETVTPRLLAELLEMAGRKAPPGSRAVYALTKPDLLEPAEVARAVTEVLGIAAGNQVTLVERGVAVDLAGAVIA
jgi:probable selenium-dependent hydroxylase accessory protein YqeC